jgi:hypothetical protein
MGLSDWNGDNHGSEWAEWGLFNVGVRRPNIRAVVHVC